MKITAQSDHNFSLSEIKAFLRISDDQTSEDDVLMSMVASAVAWYESATGVFLRTTQLTHRFSESPASIVYRPFVDLQVALDDSSASQISSIEREDLIGGGSVFTWDALALGAMTLILRVGHATREEIPDTAAQAVRALVADMYVNREYLNGNRMPSSISAAMLLGESRTSI